MDACIDLEPILTVSREEVVLSLVQMCRDKGRGDEAIDPVPAAIRSGGTDPAKHVVQSQLGEPMVKTLATYTGGKDAHEKAGLILSLIAGFDVGRRIIGVDAMQASRNEALRPYLTDAIGVILKG